MSRDKRNAQVSGGLHHGEIVRSADSGDQLRVSGERYSRQIDRRLVDRRRYNSIDFSR